MKINNERNIRNTSALVSSSKEKYLKNVKKKKQKKKLKYNEKSLKFAKLLFHYISTRANASYYESKETIKDTKRHKSKHKDKMCRNDRESMTSKYTIKVTEHKHDETN